MVVSDGQAKELLNIQPEHIRVPVTYIEKLLEVQRYAETLYPLRIGDVQEQLLNEMSFAIPHLKITDPKNIEYDGAAVFNTTLGHIVGNLSPIETKGLNLMTGKLNYGDVKVDMEGEQVIMRILKGKSKFKLKNKDKNSLTFQINISINANLAENYGSYNTYKIGRYEKPLEEKLKRVAEDTIKKLQNELNTDIIGLNSYLRGKHYKLWESIKDDWEKGEYYFQKSKIEVKVDATMKNEGNAIDTTE